MDKKNLSKLALLGLIVASSNTNVVEAAEGSVFSNGATVLAGGCGGKGKCGGSTISMEDASNYNQGQRSTCAGKGYPANNGSQGSCAGKGYPANGTPVQPAQPQSEVKNADGSYTYYYNNNSCANKTYRQTADNTATRQNVQNSTYNTNRNFQDTQTQYYTNPNSPQNRYYNDNTNFYNQDLNRGYENQNPGNPGQPPVGGNQPYQPKSSSRGY